MAHTVRKTLHWMKPYTAEDVIRLGYRGQIRGVTIERLNARMNKDHGRSWGLDSEVRRMFNRIHRSKQNHALRNAFHNDQLDEQILPHKLEQDKWNYD